MIKKLLLAALVCSSSPLCAGGATIKAKAGFFMPNSENLRDVYGGGPIVGAEVSWRPLPVVNLWTDAMYFSKHGWSLEKHRHRAHLRIVPVGIGVDFVLPILEVLELYIGGGPRYFSVKTKYPSQSAMDRRNARTYSKRQTEKQYPTPNRDSFRGGATGWGGGGRIGVVFCLPKYFLWDIYFDYSKKKLSFPNTSQETDVGGYTIGTALGYCF